jgi:FkbH-like protein
MKLIDALTITHDPSLSGPPLRVNLTCSFNPLHLKTFLGAELAKLTGRRVAIETGLYGDLLGNLSKASTGDTEVAFVLLEWADLDPRLGIRNLGGWGPDQLGDILQSATARVRMLESLVAQIANVKHTVISGPTLCVPPIAYTPGWQASSFDLELNTVVSEFLLAITRHRRVRVINAQRLDSIVRRGDRWDIAAEVQTGFPYTLSFASAMANQLAMLAVDRAPLKGLITDLDDTMWRGILGEVGVFGVSWDLDHHTHMHAVYQQFLHSLSSAGILVGVASKNDPALVRDVLAKRDLLVADNAIFPVEANWGPKSVSVNNILRTWNIGSDAVVFVDDSALELAEVKAAHPTIHCVQYPTRNDAEVYKTIVTLRDLFGKQVITDEDAIRLSSIRARTQVVELLNEQGTVSDAFLRDADGEVTINYAKEPIDPRALELINKTNQFNLNGTRCSQLEWERYLTEPSSFLMIVSYKDKFGPLGKISVVAGRQEGGQVIVDYWVMSCRAFARRIEFQCLLQLFHRFDVESVKLEFVETERNRPMRDFLEALGMTSNLLELNRKSVERVPHEGIHRVVELNFCREAVERARSQA